MNQSYRKRLKIKLKIRFKELVGMTRLFFGFCPVCNSDAPAIYDCNTCHGRSFSIFDGQAQEEIADRFQYQLRREEKDLEEKAFTPKF